MPGPPCWSSESNPVELPPEALRRTCDPASLPFDTTADLPVLSEVLGQPRAVAALELGTGIDSHGFNLFALGQPGSGKTTLIREYLERRAAAEPAPNDLCYVHNFADPLRPLPLLLPPGQGSQLRQDIDHLVEELKAAIPAAFDAEEYASQRNKIVQELEERRREEFSLLQRHVSQAGFQLIKGPGGIMIVPVVGEKMLSDQDVEQLGPEDRDKIVRAQERLQRDLDERIRAVRDLERAARDALHTLDTETAAFATRHLIDELRARYRELPAVLQFLDAFQADVVEHVDDFRKGKEAEAPALPIPLPPGLDRSLTRYQVNVVVDQRGVAGAPVVVESNPTYHNLTGRVEHQATWGGVYTNHTMIKAGALHRANGGYLVVPARECLLSPFAWEGLKRALKDRSLRIEQVGAQLSLVSTVTLDPEPVPLNVKVVLIGSHALYYMLYAYDEDFQKLFKVKADFTTRMERTPESEQAYGLFLASLARQEKTLPFDRTAVARVIEHGSRAVEDQDQLSTRFGDIADLAREAAYHAARGGRAAVTAADIRAAEDARRFRQNLLEERLHETIQKGTVLLATTGTAIGCINGLSVLSMGDYAFGHPARLTATVAPGRAGVVSIEREVELSGPIHGKGVLILNGYLLRQYGSAGPLSLSASLVFEQSYSLVEGDSASLAELCVLLSALAEVPLRQDIAVTGSVNQHGEVQPIGGVAEKIEGFFDVCRARGLTGTQGVLIPEPNRRHLMLRDDVVEAVRDGRFHVWTAGRVDDALHLLTGLPAGARDASGAFPEGSLHHAVTGRLARYTETLRAASAPAGGEAKA